MSASNWFIGVGLFTVAAAGTLLSYRMTTTPEQIVVPAPKVELSCPTTPAPVVNVEAPASKAHDTTTGKPYVCTPAQAEAGECLPLVNNEGAKVPLPAARKKAKPKASAVKKLKSKWVAPDPFKLEDIFNVSRKP